MENVHTADHGSLVHEWKCIHSPWDTSNLGVHLNQNFTDDGSQVLSSLDGRSKNDLRWHRNLTEQESLHIIVKLASCLRTGEQANNTLSFVGDLVLDNSLPGIKPHTWSYCTEFRLTTFVTNLVQALFHGGVERVGNLGVSISVENEPVLEGWLLVHLCLDLSVDVSSTLLDVKSILRTTASGTHHKLTSLVLVSLKGSWLLIELKMPLLLLLNALLILLED